ncbi:MAG: hypothetical protein JW963_10255 [Anaerolineales bacterium]|nr:hypothetical protein [Anaerolineales bacterium]
MRAFMRFTLPNKKIIWQLALASLVSMLVYLAASAFYNRAGFPLDDSWIHLTYARNLAFHGEWAFQPGRPSAGSTAPLWTALLSIGFFLKLAPYIWTYLLGALLLWGMGLLGEMVLRQVSPTYRSRIPWVGLFLILEWHLVWAAASGMETLLHALLVTTVLSMLMSGSRRFMALGLLAGLSVWVRPDGITLLGPVAVYALASKGGGKKRWKDLSLFFIGFASLFVPYLLFNLILAGTPMPNTFYAKQAEYAAWQARPFLGRFGELSLQFLLGPSLALLPGAIGWFIVSLRKRDWGTLVGMAWFAGYLFLYVERLPVYQHGRYIMPAMPIFFLWGLTAILEFAPTKLFGRYHWLASTGWNLLTGLLCVAFWLVGANTYAQDVTLIETEMVASAKWVAENIPEEEIIAAHDIGALGYFDTHELIDLAGLVSPEVIPFIRDEQRLAEFLDDSGAVYLIAFPDFYPLLSELGEPVYITAGIGPKLGGNNMVVFHWR